MSFEIFRHPSSTRTGPKISNQTCPKLLATTLCCKPSPSANLQAHAATLYDVDGGNFIFKNTWPDQPEIRIPVIRTTWGHSSWDGLSLI